MRSSVLPTDLTRSSVINSQFRFDFQSCESWRNETPIWGLPNGRRMMPRTFGRFECPCGGTTWAVAICLDDNGLEELICISCGRVAKLTAKLTIKRKSTR